MTILTFLTSAVAYLLLLLAGLWCWIQWRHRRLIQAASNIHSVLPTLPIIGSLHYLFLGVDKVTIMCIHNMTKLRQRGVFTICLWMGPYPLIIINGVQDIENILTSTKSLRLGSQVKHFEFVFKKSLLTAPENIWRITRPALEPVFHPRNLSLMMPVFNSNSREFVAKLSEYENKGHVDMFPHIMPYALKSICNLIFDSQLEFDTTTEDFHRMITVIKRIPILIAKNIFYCWLTYGVIFKILFREDLKTIDTYFNSFVSTPLKVSKEINAKKELQSNKLKKSHNYEHVTLEEPINLISAYSKLQKQYPTFTEEDLKSEINSFFSLGTDTVTTAVSSCLLLLAYHQDIQDKLFEEILSVVDLERDITYDDIKRMTYLDQVFKETLRWSCIVPITTRQPTQDTTLSDYTHPSGSTAFVGIGGPSMDPKIFQHPMKFDPERFSSEDLKQRSRFSFLPFGGGPRNCIGKAYSNLLIKTMVIQVIRRFKLSTSMEIYKMKRKYNVFIMSAEGYKISLESRHLNS